MSHNSPSVKNPSCDASRFVHLSSCCGLVESALFQLNAISNVCIDFTLFSLEWALTWLEAVKKDFLPENTLFCLHVFFSFQEIWTAQAVTTEFSESRVVLYGPNPKGFSPKPYLDKTHLGTNNCFHLSLKVCLQGLIKSEGFWKAQRENTLSGWFDRHVVMIFVIKIPMKWSFGPLFFSFLLSGHHGLWTTHSNWGRRCQMITPGSFMLNFILNIYWWLMSWM